MSASLDGDHVFRLSRSYVTFNREIPKAGEPGIEERVRKMGGAGYQPALLGNLPGGMEVGVPTKPAPGWFIDASPVPSGRLPGGTGW